MKSHRKVCAVCGKNDSRKTFMAPTCDVKRERWIASCGVALDKGAPVCERHFQKSDFIDLASRRSRLLPRAVPLPCISVDKNPLDMVPSTSSSRIKAQTSDGNILYVPVYKIDSVKSLAPSLAGRRNLTIKPVVTKKLTNLINEELFDETETADEPTEAMVVNEATQDIEPIKGEYIQSNDDEAPKHSYMSTGVQTDSSIARTCGYIESSPDDNIYSMNCFHCAEHFPIWDWIKFVAHVKENHQDWEESFANTDDLYNDDTYIEKQNGSFTIKYIDGKESPEIPYGIQNEVYIVENQDNSMCKEEYQPTAMEIEAIKAEPIEDVPEVPEETILNEYSTYHASSDDESSISGDEDYVVPQRKTMVTRSAGESAKSSTFIDTGKILSSDYLSSQEEEDEDNYSIAPIYDEMSKNSAEKNKESSKRWREKLKEDQIKLQNNKLKNNERMRKARQKWKALAQGNSEMIAEKRRYERIRKRKSRQKLAEMRNAKQTQNEPTKCKQTFAKAVKKVEDALPKNMQKKLKATRANKTKDKNNSSKTRPESVVNSMKQEEGHNFVMVKK